LYLYGPSAKVLAKINFKKMWMEHRWTTSGVHIHVDHIWNMGGTYKMVLLPPSSINFGIILNQFGIGNNLKTSEK